LHLILLSLHFTFYILHLILLSSHFTFYISHFLTARKMNENPYFASMILLSKTD